MQYVNIESSHTYLKENLFSSLAHAAKKKTKKTLVSIVVNQLTGKFIMHDKLAC